MKPLKDQTDRQVIAEILELLDAPGAIARLKLNCGNRRDELVEELDRRFLNGWHARQSELVNKEWELRLEVYHIKNGDIVREVQ